MKNILLLKIWKSFLQEDSGFLRFLKTEYFQMRKRGIFDDDYDDDELCPKGALTPRTPRTLTAPIVILNPPPGRSTQGRRIEILPSK